MISESFLALSLGLAIVLPAAPIEEKAAPKTAETPAEKLRLALDRPTSIEFTEQPINLALNQLRDQIKLNLVVDRFTLNQLGIDLESQPVSANFKDVKLRSALRTILRPHNLSFAVIGDTILVSTDEMCMHRQMRQRVNVDFDNEPLGTALKKLARETGTNVVLDTKIAREAATTVTLQLDDVPYETAVKLMTEMAGLKAVRVGNVLYVCTKQHAHEMRQDPDFAQPHAQPGEVPPGFGQWAPGMPQFFPNPPPAGIGGPVPPGAIEAPIPAQPPAPMPMQPPAPNMNPPAPPPMPMTTPPAPPPGR